MDRTTKEYIDILNNCKNKENIGNSCWEHCAYRENGCCELYKNEIITTLLREIVGENVTYSENFIWDLKDSIENRENNSSLNCCMIGDRGTIYLTEKMREKAHIKSGDFLSIEIKDNGEIAIKKIDN